MRSIDTEGLIDLDKEGLRKLAWEANDSGFLCSTDFPGDLLKAYIYGNHARSEGVVTEGEYKEILSELDKAIDHFSWCSCENFDY